MKKAPPGLAARPAPTSHTDTDRALGAAVRDAIESWCDNELAQRALGGPVTSFEHPRWGSVVVLVEPSLQMTHEAMKRARGRMDLS